jgi:hypothetical protein
VYFLPLRIVLIITPFTPDKIHTELKYIISINIFLLVLINECISQSINYFGIDLSKTVVNNLSKNSSGYIIEPIYIFKSKSKFISLKSIVGYSNVHKEDIYVNSNMHIKGGYFKLGFGYSKNKFFTPYLNLTASLYNVNNKYMLEGEYFGDYYGEYTLNELVAFAFEPNLDFCINISDRLALLLSFRLDILIYKTNIRPYPDYYVPGLGIIDNREITGGVNLYILFN